MHVLQPTRRRSWRIWGKAPELCLGGGFGKVSIDENRIKMEKDGHRQLYLLSFLFSGLYGRTVHLYFGGMDVCIASDGKSGGSFWLRWYWAV